MYFICVWANKSSNELQFENSIPLLFLGKWLNENKCEEEFHIIFLHGKSFLSKEYLNKLVNVPNYKVFCYEKEYKDLIEVHNSILRFGEYESNCFFRWLIIQKHLEKTKITHHFIHIDGDVLFNASPKEILNGTKEQTFVLQGCPGFVSIKNYKWFDDFNKEFFLFSKNIDDYSTKAWNVREGWKTSHKLKWAGSRFRMVLSSDQDFLSHLIHTDKILQLDPQVFSKQSTLYYAENPLYIHSHAQIQLNKEKDLKFSIIENRCFIENKKIAVWHFQNNFVKYLSHFLFLKKRHFPFLVPNELEAGIWTKLFLKYINRYNSLKRLQIYQQIKELNATDSTAQLSFSDIFHKKNFWKNGVFR